MEVCLERPLSTSALLAVIPFRPRNTPEVYAPPLVHEHRRLPPPVCSVVALECEDGCDGRANGVRTGFGIAIATTSHTLRQTEARWNEVSGVVSSARLTTSFVTPPHGSSDRSESFQMRFHLRSLHKMYRLSSSKIP